MTDKQINKRFAQYILDSESRRDSNGNLEVYDLPAGDGGGDYEVAGINQRYHPKMADQLATMIDQGMHAEAEVMARNYLFSYTDKVDEWHPDEVVEGFLRSCAFNRGAGGAAWMLQYALKYAFHPSLYTMERDRKVGKGTRAASKKADPELLLPALLTARVVYERTAIPGLKGSRNESSKFWHGLYRRFNNDYVFAMSLRK